jgi:hypothetical protein
MALASTPKPVARCPSEEELAVLLDATATASRIPDLLAHLDVCADCRHLAATLGRITRDDLTVLPTP